MSTTSGNRAIFALAAALAFAAFGCQQATDSEPDDENVAQAGQELDPVDADGEVDDSEGGIVLPGGDCEQGEHNDPQPQPWRNGANSGSSKPGPGPVDPSVKTSSVVPSGGHH